MIVTESGRQTLYKKWNFWRTRKQAKLYSHLLQAWTRKLLTAPSSQQRRLKFLHPAACWKRAGRTGVKLKGKLKWLAENRTSGEACKVVTYSRRKRDIKTLIVLLSQQMGGGGGGAQGRGRRLHFCIHVTEPCMLQETGRNRLGVSSRGRDLHFCVRGTHYKIQNNFILCRNYMFCHITY